MLRYAIVFFASIVRQELYAAGEGAASSENEEEEKKAPDADVQPIRYVVVVAEVFYGDGQRRVCLARNYAGVVREDVSRGCWLLFDVGEEKPTVGGTETKFISLLPAPKPRLW